MKPETTIPNLTPEQLSAVTELGRRAANLLPALLTELERALPGSSEEFFAFRARLTEENRRGARKTDGRIV